MYGALCLNNFPALKRGREGSTAQLGRREYSLMKEEGSTVLYTVKRGVYRARELCLGSEVQA
jgi:hypothetical protein